MSEPALAAACATLLAPCLLASLLAGGGAAWFLRDRVFVSLVLVGVALALPALGAVLVAAPPGAALGLVILFTPPLAAAWRRLPAGLWRTARALGASRALVIRALVLPPLTVPLLIAAVLGVALLAGRVALVG